MAGGDVAQDFYDVLGVPSGASEEEIRSAYRIKAQLLHPDRHVGAPSQVREAAAKEFSELTAAYEVLSDATQRAKYDRFLLEQVSAETPRNAPATPRPPSEKGTCDACGQWNFPTALHCSACGAELEQFRQERSQAGGVNELRSLSDWWQFIPWAFRVPSRIFVMTFLALTLIANQMMGVNDQGPTRTAPDATPFLNFINVVGGVLFLVVIVGAKWFFAGPAVIEARLRLDKRFRSAAERAGLI